MKFMYPAVFRKNEDGTYNGYFPDLECCTSTGDTLDEAIENANEAAYNWITVELDEEEPNRPEPDPGRHRPHHLRKYSILRRLG